MTTYSSASKFPELMPYAVTEQNSEGRIYQEYSHPEDLRCAFLHDRDRIIHSKAFRRLEAKTQVVLIHESDHSRTRLTHSLEVNQISETIALSLGLNAYATSAIALGHDVGHTPFGHIGERAISSILTDYGLDPFKHNYQSVLVVNTLERRYSDYEGLNLMLETRDGILKHSSLKKSIDLKFYDKFLSDDKEWPISLEGQIVRIVDEIAQRTHDTDDALRTNRIAMSDLLGQEVVKKSLSKSNLKPKDLVDQFNKDKSLIISTIIISLIKFYVLQTINNSRKYIKLKNIKSIDDVKKSDILIIDWDSKFKDADDKFANDFLRPRFYEHHEIKRMDSRAEFFLRQIFKAFLQHTKQLPESNHKEFIAAVRKSLDETLTSCKEGKFKEDLKEFLNCENLKCSETCWYIPKSKYPHKEQIINSFCPLLKHGKKLVLVSG